MSLWLSTDGGNTGDRFFGKSWIYLRASRSVVFSPLVVTHKSMSELWRIIIDESQGHYAGPRREASELRLLSPVSLLIYQDSIFSCTWNSNGLVGINNDSCEANIVDFRGLINAAGIDCDNSPIIYNIPQPA